MDKDDNLLRRIANVSNYYRGARWHITFDSSEGGTWGYTLESAGDQEIGEGEIEQHPILPIFFRRVNEPVFAMRCTELAVIAEALESWHSKTLVREM